MDRRYHDVNDIRHTDKWLILTSELVRGVVLGRLVRAGACLDGFDDDVALTTLAHDRTYPGSIVLDRPRPLRGATKAACPVFFDTVGLL